MFYIRNIYFEKAIRRRTFFNLLHIHVSLLFVSSPSFSLSSLITNSSLTLCFFLIFNSFPSSPTYVLLFLHPPLFFFVVYFISHLSFFFLIFLLLFLFLLLLLFLLLFLFLQMKSSIFSESPCTAWDVEIMYTIYCTSIYHTGI